MRGMYRGLILFDDAWQSSEVLRSYCLYWDRLFIPGQPNNHWDEENHWARYESAISSPDLQFLKQEGVLSFAPVGDGYWIKEEQYAGSRDFRDFAKDFVRDRYSDVMLTVAQASPLSLPSQADFADGRSALFTLQQALPVPMREVPLDDVLTFKRARHDELTALRHHLEEIYQRILGAPDIQLKAIGEIERLDLALSDLAKCVMETRFPFRWTGFEAKFVLDVQGAGLGALIGGLAGSAVGMPHLSAVGAVLGAVKVQFGGGIRAKEASATPLEYVALMEQELPGPT